MGPAYLFVFFVVCVLIQARETFEAAPDDVSVTSVTVVPGETAQLNCSVKDLNTHQVFWVRNKDSHILTYGMLTYTQDYRFRVRHENGTNLWSLLIKFPVLEDSGVYVCQTDKTPEERRLFKLIVLEPRSEILGGPNIYFSRGSTINITCVINTALQQVIWKFNNDIISYDNPRGGLTMTTQPGLGRTTVSTLLLRRSERSDTGVYQCTTIDGLPTASAHVYVENVDPVTTEIPSASLAINNV